MISRILDRRLKRPEASLTPAVQQGVTRRHPVASDSLDAANWP